jgi:hypothetical protein
VSALEQEEGQERETEGEGGEQSKEILFPPPPFSGLHLHCTYMRAPEREGARARARKRVWRVNVGACTPLPRITNSTTVSPSHAISLPPMQKCTLCPPPLILLLHTVESLSIDLRDVLIAEPGCCLVHCIIPHLHIWALALLGFPMYTYTLHTNTHARTHKNTCMIHTHTHTHTHALPVESRSLFRKDHNALAPLTAAAQRQRIA